jgi:uncharacterized protein YkwD
MKLMKKYYAIMSLFLLFTSISLMDIQAQENGDLLLPSKIEILNKYHQHPFRFNDEESTQYTIEPTVGYVYTVGQVEEEELQRALGVSNLARRLVGLPGDLQLDSQLNKVAQYASYVNMLNATISHYPEKPSLISDETYQIGKEGSAASNLAAGFPTIASSILWGYLQDDDAYNIGVVGHRRWLLNPSMQKIGFGYVDTLVSSSYNGFTATYVFDQSRKTTLDYQYIAWPAAGNMPIEFIKTSTPWSIHLGEDYDNPQMNSVTVELTNMDTGEIFVFNNETNSNTASAINTSFFTIENSLYGIDKTIIFRPNPNEISYESGDNFRVDVSGITMEGYEMPITYEVNFFDLEDQPSIWAFEELLEADAMQLIPEMLMDNYTDDITRIDFTRLLIYGLQEYTGQTYNELLQSEGYSEIGFTDTSDVDVELAAGLGIVNGIGNNQFNPNGGIRRQEAAAMLYRVGEYLEISRSETEEQGFTDEEGISDWAEEAVDYVSTVVDPANNKAVMGGLADGSFAPNSPYTREQAIITIKRLLNR